MNHSTRQVGKIIEAGAAVNVLTRLNCCAALLVENVKALLAAGVPRAYLLPLVGSCDLLEAIIQDFLKEVEAAECVYVTVNGHGIAVKPAHGKEQPMRRWKVYLPGEVFTMESDDPRTDLIAQGYDVFGLCEITGMDVPDIPRPRMRRNKKPPESGGGRKRANA